MRRWMIQLVVLALLNVTACPAGEVLFRDDFKGRLADGWSWVREEPAAWRMTDGALEIRVQPGNMWGKANDAKNVLIRPVSIVPGDRIAVFATVANQPTEQYEQVDLVWYYDDSHMVKIGQELVNGKLSVVMGREEKDRTRTIAILPVEPGALELQFQVSASGIRGLFRLAGSDAWREAGVCTLPAHGDPKVSLQVYQGPSTAEHWARLKDFRIERTRKASE